MYGAEVWEWKEREQLEKIQKRYIKWTLKSRLLHIGLCCVLYKKTNVERIGTIAGSRAVQFKEKA